MAPKTDSQPVEVLSLPASVVSQVDAGRMTRELEALDSHFEQKHNGQSGTVLPKLSPMLDESARLNQLDLSEAAERTRLHNFLKEVKSDAPVIHMSFAVEPPSVFTAKLVSWLRDEIHPMLLLEVGLQPSIAAGCIIRTTNKYFDCSMRQHLVQNKPRLMELLRGASHA